MEEQKKSLVDAGSLYSPSMGLVYIFNLIVGTGALTMPKAFAAAGWLASCILLAVLAFMSFLTTTFVIEAMAVANACLRHNIKEEERKNKVVEKYHERMKNVKVLENTIEQIQKRNSSNNLASCSDTVDTSIEDLRPVQDCHDDEPLLIPTNESQRKYQQNRNTNPRKRDEYFKISDRVEMGQMADMFFSKVGRTLFYLCITIYLYGDLAIYAAAVPKSLCDIACGNLSCTSLNSSYHIPKDSDICWEPNITRNDAYRIFVAAFTIVMGPFAFFNAQKTKYLQVATTILRWIAFSLMIVLSVVHIAQDNGGSGHPVPVDISSVPTLFGVCVYSFMCQHSLPSLVTPISNKSRLSSLVGLDYLLILMFYLLLCLTAIFCFSNDSLKDMYTLNFQDSCDVTSVAFIRYFLGLFPVFTLSTNFPIITVTLRNNLKALFSRRDNTPYPFIVDRICFPLLALVPPVAIAFGTNDLSALVGYTGSYAGTAVQYIIPAFLVLLARREAIKMHGVAIAAGNQHRSPFKRRIWILLVLVWAVVCLVFVTANHVLAFTHGHHGNLTDLFWVDSKWSWMSIKRITQS